MTRMTRISADNKSKIRVNLRHPRHLCSKNANVVQMVRIIVDEYERCGFDSCRQRKKLKQ